MHSLPIFTLACSILIQCGHAIELTSRNQLVSRANAINPAPSCVTSPKVPQPPLRVCDQTGSVKRPSYIANYTLDTQEECRDKCLNSGPRCVSFSYGPDQLCSTYNKKILDMGLTRNPSTGTTFWNRRCYKKTCGVCPEGLSNCSGQCVDLQGDGTNCGTCGTTCSATGSTCQSGSCSVDTCSNACDATHSLCNSGTCSCTESQILCNGQCVDAGSSDPKCAVCDLSSEGFSGWATGQHVHYDSSLPGPTFRTNFTSSLTQCDASIECAHFTQTHSGNTFELVFVTSKNYWYCTSITPAKPDVRHFAEKFDDISQMYVFVSDTTDGSGSGGDSR